MTTPRASVVRGPAIIQFQSQTFYTKQDFIMRPMLKLGPVMTSMFGTVTQSVTDMMWQLQFVPDGQLIDGHIAVLWPYATTYPGTSMAGAADSDIVIWTRAGQKITFAAGFVQQMPNLFFGPTQTVLGSCTMMAIGKLSTAYNAADKWASISSTAFSDTSFDPANIKKMQYTGAWGNSPWDAFEVEDGFAVSFQVQSTPDRMAGVTNDYIFEDLTATVQALPGGVTEAQILAAMDLDDTNFLPGSAINTLTANNDLVIGAGASKPQFTLTKCSISDAGLNFGTGKRIGAVTWQSTRTITSGALTALFAIDWSLAA